MQETFSGNGSKTEAYIVSSETDSPTPLQVGELLFYFDSLLNLVIVAARISAANEVTDKSGKEQLQAHEHTNEEDEEPCRVGKRTIDIVAQFDNLLNAHDDKRYEAYEEHYRAEETENMHRLLPIVRKEPQR